LEYVMAFSGRGRAVLDDGSTRESVAAECREAALAFVNGVAAGWDKLDVALWLTGPYARATRHVPRGERVTGIGEETDIADEAIEALVTRVRAQLVASLETAALGEGTLEFAVEAMDRGLVRRALDADGEVVWVPADNTRMRLKDRVRSLFAADYLNDPGAYASLYVCHRCETVVLDENAKRLGACQNHKRVSGVVPRQIEHDSEQEIVPAFAVGDDE
jgi:hypothetical protein